MKWSEANRKDKWWNVTKKRERERRRSERFTEAREAQVKGNWHNSDRLFTSWPTNRRNLDLYVTRTQGTKSHAGRQVRRKLLSPLRLLDAREKVPYRPTGASEIDKNGLRLPQDYVFTWVTLTDGIRTLKQPLFKVTLKSIGGDWWLGSAEMWHDR